MLKFQIKGKDYEIPNAWEELTAEQYLCLAELLLKYSMGDLSVAELRIKFLFKLLDLKFKKNIKEEMFYQNLYLLSRQLTFMFKIVYENKEQFSFFSPDTQKMLERYLPEDLYPSPEIEMAERMRCHFVIDAHFSKNLLPELAGVKGYEFDAEDGFVSTTLTAEDYIHSIMLYSAYVESGKKEHLMMLAEALYPDARDFTEAELNGVFLNFGAIQSFLYETKYGILWKRKGARQKNKLSVGLADSLYTLSTEGYGNLNEVKNYNLMTYLDLLLKQLLDSVKMLESYDLDLPEIAKKTGLTIEQLSTIL